jgi:hypothetical protein
VTVIDGLADPAPGDTQPVIRAAISANRRMEVTIPSEPAADPRDTPHPRRRRTAR